MAAQLLRPGLKEKLGVDIVACTELEVEDGGVTTTLWVPPADTCPAPLAPEYHPFLAMLGWVLDRFAPDIVLTYGGHEVGRRLLDMCRERDIAVVFRDAGQTDAWQEALETRFPEKILDLNKRAFAEGKRLANGS